MKDAMIVKFSLSSVWATSFAFSPDGGNIASGCFDPDDAHENIN